MRTKRALVVIAIVLCGAGVATGQTEWVEHPDNPVIVAADPGSWAPGGPWVNAMVFDGAIYHMWFTGTKENGYANNIGHATSADGVAWTMDPANPVLAAGAPGEWDDDPLIAGAVIHDGSQFHMWYTGTDDIAENIGYATSPDGSVWIKYSGNPVMEVGTCGAWDDKWLMSGAVIDDGDTYRMWYSGSNGSIGKIGFAESPDGIEWTKRPEPVLEPGDTPGAWDGNLFSASVVFDGATYHLWYNADLPSVATNIGYAYSGDGIEWTKHRGNPILSVTDENIWSSPVFLDGSTWHMWFTHDKGLTPRNYEVSYVTSDCCAGVAALDNWRFIPAAAVATGAQGAFYQTDVDVNNADDQVVEYEFSWLPRGETNTEPVTSEVFTLGAGMSIRYTNVLSEVFGLEPNSFGALLIKSSSHNLLAMSRTYNLGSGESGGTYGQSMPAIGPDEFIGYGEPRRLLFGSENADLRTNVGCQNSGLDGVAVFLELFDSEGTSLDRPYMILRALGNDQLNRIFDGHNPVNGYVDISIMTPKGSAYCFGSVLDNVTSDPTTILPQ